jgi:hypothetical protein
MSNKEFKMLNMEEILKQPVLSNSERGAHIIFIDWKHECLDIVDRKELDRYHKNTDDLEYHFEFDRFLSENWLFHLAQKGWLDIYTIANIGQAMLFVIANNYVQPENHDTNQRYVPWGTKWSTNVSRV